MRIIEFLCKNKTTSVVDEKNFHQTNLVDSYVRWRSIFFSARFNACEIRCSWFARTTRFFFRFFLVIFLRDFHVRRRRVCGWGGAVTYGYIDKVYEHASLNRFLCLCFPLNEVCVPIMRKTVLLHNNVKLNAV